MLGAIRGRCCGFTSTYFDAGDKYLLPELAKSAMEAMDLMLATIFTDEEAADVNFYATDDVFELVEAPPERSDSDETAAGVDRYGVDDVCELAKAPSERSISRPELLSKSNEPVKKNLAALNCLDEFREWLEENGDAWALETVFDVSDGVESFRRRRYVGC